MSHEAKSEEYNELAIKVSSLLYQELQRNPDEPLPKSILIKHLKHSLKFDNSRLKSLQEEIGGNRNLDYQDIVAYLSSHSEVTQAMNQYFINHPIQAIIPRIPSLSHLRNLPASYSQYHLQQTEHLRPTDIYVYDQMGGMGGIAVRGTTMHGGGGTIYEHPLYHGRLAFANASPTGNNHLPLLSGAKKSLRHDEFEHKSTDMDTSDSSESVTNNSSVTKTKNETLTMDAWVRYHSGNKVISKLLIANNGIAAVKCIQSVRIWCYETFGDMNAIHFVCMATPEDTASNAEYIRMADEVVPVPGGSNNYNYANVTIIVTIAKQTKCDAVWPGWGHASEYPSLPRALAQHGIGWVGPDADAMYASGDKIVSTLIAQSAKVPTIPWSGSSVRVQYRRGAQDSMSEVRNGFKQACITDLNGAIECAEKIGYPVMIKASEGGGGKGIRKCESAKGMKACYTQVRSEVPGSPIFVMKLAVNARHLEVQLLGDHWGNVIALFGRDCSMQRRHQKIIEEGPVINVDEKVLIEMEQSAVALAKQVRYVGAGTVEFLYDNDSKTYAFLELNPRLQVEHTVTELISGINLPAAQVQVAMGVPLYCIADIRRLYACKDVTDTTAFDLDCVAQRIRPLQHAIACRITAENPLNNFAPTSGLISELHFRPLPNVWGYFSLKTKSSIHEYADSQFGHIFASGQTRDDARKAMVLALSQLEIRGEIRTTIEFLSSILENGEYKRGHFHTTWLEQQMRKNSILRVPSHLSPEKIVLLGAIADGHAALTVIERKLLSDLKHGRNINRAKYTDALVAIPVQLIYKNVKYRILIEKSSPSTYTMRYKAWKCDVVVRNLSDSGCLVSLDGRSHVLYAEWNAAEQLVLTVDGHTVVFEQEYDPSNIRAVMPGKLVKILIQNGQHVSKGDPFAEIEVMKMYMPLIVPESGIIDVIAQEGSILQIGQRIATMKLDDESQVTKANAYEKDSFPAMTAPEKKSVRVDRKYINAKKRVECMLDGYIAHTDIDDTYVRENVDLMMNALRDPTLPLDEFNSALEPLHGRIDPNLYQKFTDKASNYEKNLKINRFRWEKPSSFPSESILAYIEAYKQRLGNSETEIAAFEASIDPLRIVCNRHKKGTHFYAVQVICDLLDTFSLRENRFIDADFNSVVHELRREAPNNLANVAVIVTSHFQLAHREKVIMELLNIVDSIFHNRMYEFISELSHVLQVMTTLTDIKYGKIHLKCREILASIDIASESQRKMEIENMLKSHPSLLQRSLPSPQKITKQSSSEFDTLSKRRTNKDLFNDEGLLHTIPDLLDILPKHMLSENENVACNAVELWIRSVFAPPFYFVDKRSMNIKWSIDESTQCSFTFSNVNPKDNKAQQSKFKPKKNKQGFFGFYANENEMKAQFKNIIDQFPRKESIPSHVIILGFEDKQCNEKEFTVTMEKYFTPFREKLNNAGISFISVFVPSNHGNSAHLFTFRYMLDFREDPMTRHILPPLVTMLEMDRLKQGFTIQWMPTENRRIHIFEASPMKRRLFTRNWDGKRLFARVPVAQMVSPTTMIEDIINDYYRFGGPEFALMEATHVLESLMSNSSKSNPNKYRYNHILLACFFDTDFSDEIDTDFSDEKWKKRVFTYIYGRIERDYLIFAKQLKRLHITHIEIRFQIRLNKRSANAQKTMNVRAFLDEPGMNGVINIHLYIEKTSFEDGSVKLIDPGYGKQLGRLHGSDAFAEHIVEHQLMAQRITAKDLQTTYVYDWPILFEKALRNIWFDYKKTQSKSDIPFEDNLISFEEYILNKEKTLEKISRAPGQNSVAMVVWKVSMKTPEFPQGRDIIIVSNDITNNLGTFAISEDETYNAACVWAMREGLPFIYLSANSGARIGLSAAIMTKFKVAWAHEQSQSSQNKDSNIKMNKESQFEPQYLYLDEKDYKEMVKSETTKTKLLNVEYLKESRRYKILDIIGKYGIGVENLSGSGLIAGTTSAANKRTFTLSYVTGRSVGIGAYLVRLTQRIIQKSDSPILLTGYVALNNLLGKSVYISNQQIGGSDEVMSPNGVSHMKVGDDLEGAYQILKWLSYVPHSFGSPHTIESNLLSLYDPVDRDCEYYPFTDKYDPRLLIAGDYKNQSLRLPTHKSENGEEQKSDKSEIECPITANESWQSGLFDRDSFTEYLSQWATSVCIGRARLGGIPVGVIAAETRTTQCCIPPDPALESASSEIMWSKPGKVWYPDSSFKTAQAIRDFKCENLPLFILANWRGFSGGQRDMFHQILKYGSYIVDELQSYAEPVFVYLPPTAELRGGAWVVLDSLINQRCIEMYSSSTAKANVLEPTGTVGLKYRKQKLLATMHRIDPKLMDLAQKLKLSKGNKNELTQEIVNRERALFPIYNKIALMYAQLHDTPQRMKDVGVIRDVVPWRNSRRFFYWRLRRKLIVLNKCKEINDDDYAMAKQAFDAFVKQNYTKDNKDSGSDCDDCKYHNSDSVIANDKVFVQWFMGKETEFATFVKARKRGQIEHKLKLLIHEYNGSAKDLKAMFDKVLLSSQQQSDEDIVVNVD